MIKFLWSAIFVLILTSAAHATVFEVGSGKQYSKISDVVTLVQPGDRVDIYPGVYTEVMRWQVPGTAMNPIVVRGVGATKPVLDAHGLNVDGTLPNPRAIMQFEGDYYIVENLEFKNARNVNGNGAGIRIRGAYNVTVRLCHIHNCDMGMMSDSMNDLLVEHCEVNDNGDGTGYAHNFYLSGTNATVRFCEIYNANGGQNFKCRLHYVELLYNYIHDADSKEIDIVDSQYNTTIPNSNALVVGNLVIKKQAALNTGQYLIFGQDLGNDRIGTLYCYYNTFIATDQKNKFIWINNSQSKGIFVGNIFYGSNSMIYDANTDARILTGSRNNWIPTTASAPTNFAASVKGTLPDFVDSVANNYHLNQTSSCVDAGIPFSNISYVDGDGNSHTLDVFWEYYHKTQKVARFKDLMPDIGAFEYGTGSILIQIDPAVLFNGKVNEPYTQTVSASGGTQPYQYFVSQGTLPTGLTIDSTTGEISGTPQESGFFNITIQVIDRNYVIGERQYTLRVGGTGSGCSMSTLPDNSVPILSIVLIALIVIFRRFVILKRNIVKTL